MIYGTAFEMQIPKQFLAVGLLTVLPSVLAACRVAVTAAELQ
jgi:hypothetical protein